MATHGGDWRRRQTRGRPITVCGGACQQGTLENFDACWRTTCFVDLLTLLSVPLLLGTSAHLEVEEGAHATARLHSVYPQIVIACQGQHTWHTFAVQYETPPTQRKTSNSSSVRLNAMSPSLSSDETDPRPGRGANSTGTDLLIFPLFVFSQTPRD